MGLIIIEGNIGSGKTTLGRLLAKDLKRELFEELTSDFTQEVLKNFYADKSNWAFELQVQFLAERFGMIYDSQNISEVSIMDRSIYGDAIFAETLHEDGDMSNEQYSIYSNLLNQMLQSAQNPILMIYLQSSTDKLMKRIEERSRGNENLIDKGYIDRLNNKYDDWYSSYYNSQKIFIDKDNVDITNEKEYGIILNHIKDIIVNN